MRREHPRAVTNDARYVDSRRLSSLWRTSLLLANGHIQGQVIGDVDEETSSVREEYSLMGEMRRAIDREVQEQRKQDRFASTLVIAAAIIAAVRLARDDIGRPSPRLSTAISESVGLARMILERIAK